MKSNFVKYISAFAVLILIIATGYFREYVFVNINYELIDIYYKRNEWTLHGVLSIFNNWSYSNLYYFKFFLTGFFTMAYCALCCLGVFVLFRNKKYLKITVFIFAFVVIVAAIFYAYGMLFNDVKNGHKFARMLMDFVESPKIFMLVVPGFLLKDVSEKVKE